MVRGQPRKSLTNKQFLHVKLAWDLNPISTEKYSVEGLGKGKSDLLSESQSGAEFIKSYATEYKAGGREALGGMMLRDTPVVLHI